MDQSLTLHTRQVDISLLRIRISFSRSPVTVFTIVILVNRSSLQAILIQISVNQLLEYQILILLQVLYSI